MMGFVPAKGSQRKIRAVNPIALFLGVRTHLSSEAIHLGVPLELEHPLTPATPFHYADWIIRNGLSMMPSVTEP